MSVYVCASMCVCACECVCVYGGVLEKLGHIFLKKIYFVSLQLPEVAGSMLSDANVHPPFWD